MINTWPCLKTYWFVFLRCPPHSKKDPTSFTLWDGIPCFVSDWNLGPPHPPTILTHNDGNVMDTWSNWLAHIFCLIIIIIVLFCLSIAHILGPAEKVNPFFPLNGGREREKVGSQDSPGTLLYCWCPHSSFSLFCCIYFSFLLLFCTARQDYNVGGGERVRERDRGRMEKGSIFWYHGVRQPLWLSTSCWNLFENALFSHRVTHNPVESCRY